VTCVQEQFVFVHNAVISMFTQQLQLMQEHSDYYNIAPQQSAVRFLGFCIRFFVIVIGVLYSYHCLI